MRVGTLELPNIFAAREIPASRDFALPAAPSRSSIGEPSAATYGKDDKSLVGSVAFYGSESPDMWPSYRFMTYDEMRRTDGCVKANLLLYKLPIRQAKHLLEPASEDPIDRMVCDALDAQFGISDDEQGWLDLTWDEQLQQDQLCLDYGGMFEEMIWGDPIFWADADGDEHPIRPIIRLAPRYPGTVRIPDGFDTDPATGHLRSLTQDLPRANPIPGDKLCTYVIEREGADWYGTSMLRSMYGPWRLKKAVMIASGIGWDRYAYGTPWVRYPQGGGQTKRRQAESIARNIRTGERAWFVLEGTEADGWNAGILDGSRTMADPTSLIAQFNDEMSYGALTHFMMLGRTDTGSRAVGDVQSAPYYMGLQAVADMIAQQKQRQLFRRWVDVNFGPEIAVPKLRVQKIAKADILATAQAMLDLSQALPGVLSAAPERVADVLDRLDLYTGDITEREMATLLAAGSGGAAPAEGDSLGL